MLPVGKTIRRTEKWMTPVMTGATSSITVQRLGKIVQRALAVGAKMWCFFVGHAPSPERHAFEGCIVRTRIALPYKGRFVRGLRRFFRKGLYFKTRYIVLTFVARWRHNFREIAVKNCEKSKNRRKSLCAPLRIDSWGIWKKILPL